MNIFKATLYHFLFVSALTILFAVCMSGCGPRQESKTSQLQQEGSIPVKEMQSDLDTLWAAIREVHPGYNIYTSADTMAALYKQTRLSLTQPLSEEAYIAHIYPFLCALGCGHTQIRHSANYKPTGNTNSTSLPFEVQVRGAQAWVTNRRTDKVTTGDEVISINDVPVKEIIQHAAALYCGDGYIRSFKEVYLSEYDGFNDACSNYYHWAAPYKVVLRSGNGTPRQVTLAATDTSQHDAIATKDKYAQWTKTPGTGDLGLYIQKEKSIALLEVPALNYGDTLIYENCFREIANNKTKHLILDMRHNGGGDIRITIRLLSYLADTSFGIIKDLYARIPDPTENHFAHYFDPEKTESFKGSCIPAQKEGAFYHMNIKPAFGKIYAPLPLAAANRFRGDVTVLIDGATFSSAALFVTALKAQRANTFFVGRETAGTAEGCNGFAQQKLTLPATHIVVEFPLLRVISMIAPPAPGRGLQPDYEVTYTPQDIVTGTDRDLAKAISLIK